jgi:hypothetical protein
MADLDLGDRDWRILEYIKDSPGTSREGVVRGMNGDPSRITVLKALDKLVQFKLIIATKDKRNSQIHHLYINKEDVFISVSQNLQEFKNAFFVLLDKTIEEARHIPTRDDKIRIFSMLYDDFLIFYNHILGLHITYGLSKWPDEIKDHETASRLYTVIFSRMLEVHKKIFDIIRIISDEIYNDEIMYNRIVSRPQKQFIISPYLLTPKFMVEVTEKADKYGLRSEVEAVLDISWKIVHEISPPGREVMRVVNRMMDKGIPIELELRNWRRIAIFWRHEFAQENK